MSQTIHMGMEKYLMVRAKAITNRVTENILKTIFDTATGNPKNGASTMDVNGGNGE